MSLAQPKVHDARIEPREETHCRVRVRDAAGPREAMLVVNLSPNGLMARSEAILPVGHLLTFDLPEAGPRPAEVRWSLGGRLGCRFLAPIPAELYPRTLAAMR